MDENLINNTIDIRFYHYYIIISILCSVSSFLCGFYLSDHNCNLDLFKNDTNI